MRQGTTKSGVVAGLEVDTASFRAWGRTDTKRTLVRPADARHPRRTVPTMAREASSAEGPPGGRRESAFAAPQRGFHASLIGETCSSLSHGRGSNLRIGETDLPRAALVVQTFSLGYVENFVHYFHDVLRRHLDPETPLIVVDALDEAPDLGGDVFIIGENFPVFGRRTGCRYIYLNFSVVTPLGGLLSASLRGHRQILRKRRMLERKLSQIDVLLDYYAPQTEALRNRIDLPVYGFDVAIAPVSSTPVLERPYDVCFVGGMTPRRQAVLDAVAAQGLAISPHSGAPIEKLTAQSKCCLNIHMERSAHLEIPRVIAALSRGCPVVCETSLGLADWNAGDIIDERPLGQLAAGVAEMLSDRERLVARADRAARWYNDVYLAGAEARWSETLADLSARQAA